METSHAGALLAEMPQDAAGDLYVVFHECIASRHHCEMRQQEAAALQGSVGSNLNSSLSLPYQQVLKGE